jgi:hypothetical protein
MTDESGRQKTGHDHAFLLTAERGEIQLFFLLGSLTPEAARNLHKQLGGAIGLAEARAYIAKPGDIARIK